VAETLSLPRIPRHRNGEPALNFIAVVMLAIAWWLVLQKLDDYFALRVIPTTWRYVPELQSGWVIVLYAGISLVCWIFSMAKSQKGVFSDLWVAWVGTIAICTVFLSLLFMFGLEVVSAYQEIVAKYGSPFG
jgi:apolipoprotein N-acyltransferase